MENNKNVAPVVVEASVTLESVLAAMTDKERMALLLDSKKLSALKKSLPKSAGHKVNILKALAIKPMSDTELAKECNTTIKTIQSYVCYLNDDAKSDDIKHKADASKPAGVKIYLDGGKRMLKADFIKTLA